MKEYCSDQRTGASLIACAVLLLLSYINADPVEAAEFGVATATDAALRNAVQLANQTPGEDTVLIDASVGMITLNEGQIDITESVEIIGADPANPVTINAGGQSRLFSLVGIQDPDNPMSIAFENLVLTGGRTIEQGLRGNPLNNDPPPDCSGGSGQGGAICSTGSVELKDVLIEGNETEEEDAAGGGVWAAFDITLEKSVILSNMTAGVAASGGGLRSEVGAVSCNLSRIIGNSVSGENRGGGISARDVELIECQVHENVAGEVDQDDADGGVGDGGGISTEGTLSIERSTVSGNIAGRLGGGIFSIPRAIGDLPTRSGLKIVNSTISGNEARLRGGGLFWSGGEISLDIDEDGEGDSAIFNSTIVDNNAPDGAGIFLTAPSASSFSASINSSIVMLNPFGAAGGQSLVLGPNVSVVNENSFIDLADEINLGPLSDNGCATPSGPDFSIPGAPDLEAQCLETHRPGPGSPLINSGLNPLGLDFDQIGIPRLIDDAPDVGAVERSPIIKDFDVSPLELRQGETLDIEWSAVPPDTMCSGEIRNLEGEFIADWAGAELGAEGMRQFQIQAADFPPADYSISLNCTSTVGAEFVTSSEATLTFTVQEAPALEIVLFQLSTPGIEPGEGPILIEQGDDLSIKFNVNPDEGASCEAGGLSGTAWQGTAVSPEGEVDIETSEVTPGTFEVEIDTSGLTPGTFNVTLTCTLGETTVSETRVLEVLLPSTDLEIEATAVDAQIVGRKFVTLTVSNGDAQDAGDNENQNPAIGVVLTASPPANYQIVAGYRLAPSCEIAPSGSGEVRCDVDLIPDWQCTVSGDLTCDLEHFPVNGEAAELPVGGSAAVVVELQGSGASVLTGSVSARNAAEVSTEFNINE